MRNVSVEKIIKAIEEKTLLKFVLQKKTSPG